MKKLLSILTIGAITALSGSVINAIKVNDSLENINGDSEVWSKAKYSKVTLYPQTTISFNDKEAVEKNKDRKAMEALVGAVYNGKKIAFNVKWLDESKNSQSSNAIRSFGDAVALQIPTNYQDPNKLPYIGMGSKDRSVIVHLQKSAEPLFEPNGDGDVYHQQSPNNVNQYDDEISKRDGLTKFNKKVATKAKSSYERSFVAEGFRSTTEIKDGSSSFSGDMKFEEPLFGDKQWNTTFTRDLKSDYVELKDAFPLAVAIWQGEKSSRDGLKHLSSWVVVELKSGASDKFVKEFAPIKADIAKGKTLAEANCAACHNYGSTNMAPEFMAPNLSNIGGYSTASYIKESMVNPNAVIVPGYNRNAHPNTPWYNIEKGKRVSTMPEYSWLSQGDLNSIVAYFASLKAEKPKEK